MKAPTYQTYTSLIGVLYVNMKTTIRKESLTTTTTKTFVSSGVTIGVSRRHVALEIPYFANLEYSLSYKDFKKTRMSKHSFKFHLQMIKDGMFD